MVQLLGRIAEDEMVAVFLRAEFASPRFRPRLTALLARAGRDPCLIEQPDLSSAEENADRRRLLGEHRGYRRQAEVFTDFPADVR